MTSIHPACTIPYDDLIAGLETARAASLVVRRFDQATGRALYIYSNRCVYERAWTPFSILARGLILAPEERRIVALPFPKFFNYAENEASQTIPPGPFEVFEKLDGSLAIIHHHAGRWRAATKGAFESEQARWTEARLATQDLSALVPGTTYLAEAIYPENRIVVRYDAPALVLLAAYREDGTELSAPELQATADPLGWRTAKCHPFASFADLIRHAEALPVQEEGFVIRWQDGTRLKLKGAEYRRIHAIISRVTPLAIWEALAAGSDLDATRREIPEEFWTDFDAITGLLNASAAALIARIAAAAANVAHLSDKELGLTIKDVADDETRPFLFASRKSGGLNAKSRDALWRQVRPAANVLPGYVPSTGLDRVVDAE